jgi:hypothetical protein
MEGRIGIGSTQPEGCATHGLAWIGLSLALALHVADEALNGFLSFYNPMVRRIREQVPLLPLPTFEFEWWLAGLILAVAALLAVSTLVFRGRRWTIPASYVYGGFMCLNALGHFGGSIAFRRPMPGVYSSPVLAAAALWLILCARRRREPRS